MKPAYRTFLMSILLAASAAGWLFTACTDRKPKLPEKLAEAMDLFYLENRNDSVLLLLDELATEKLPAEDAQLAIIFRAAAICETGKPDSAMKILKGIKPEKLSGNIQYYYGSIRGLIEFRQFKSEEAYITLLSLNNDEAADIRAQALAERTSGRILIQYGDDKNAVDWLISSRNNFEKAGLEKSVAVNNRFLGNISIRLNQYEQALPYLNSAIAVFKKHADEAELFYAYVEMIDYYIRQNRPDSALHYVTKARNSFGVTHDKTMQALLYNNRGEIEKLKGNYAGAIEMFDSTLQLGSGYYYTEVRRQTAYLNLAEVYNKLKQPEQARKYALEALNAVNGNQKNNIKYAVYYQLARSYAPDDADRMQVYMDSAIFYLQKHHISQSVDMIQFFDTRQQLHRSQHRIEELKAKNTRNRTLFLIAGFVLFVIIAALAALSEVQKDRNRALRMLVEKNIKLLQEEVRQEKAAWRRNNNTSKRKTNSDNDQEKIRTIYVGFIHWLNDEGNFRRNDITLSIAARELNTNREYLSRAINRQDLHFNDLVNKYRVMEVIGIFSNPADVRNKLTLQVLATEVGFNSNSVFIDAFRKVTGMTPTQFREHLNENQPKLKG